jgi:iron complex transport system substrate-binding protein
MAPGERIVSLLPSATEIVFALGLGDRLAGVTFECDHPPEARGLPVVSSSGLAEGLELADIDDAVRDATADGSPLYRLDEDLIARIDPDLILTQDLCRVCAVPSGDVDEALGRLGCSAAVVSLDPHRLDDILADILRVGEAAGVGSRAHSVVGALRGRIDAVAVAVEGRTAAGADRPRVAVLEWVDPPWGAGHWIPDLVSVAGGDPVVARPGDHAHAATWTDVVDAAPDIVVVAPCGFHLADAVAQAAAAADQLADTPAGRSGNIWAVDADAHIVRPGPRVVDGLEVLAWVIAGAPGSPPHAHAAARVGPPAL